jgi:hypothetical protein
MSFLRSALIFAAAHIALTIGVFLLFGLGLEGPTIGGKILSVLMQPYLSIPFLDALPAVAQNMLVPLNSLFWGAAAAVVLRVLRTRAVTS